MPNSYYFIVNNIKTTLTEEFMYTYENLFRYFLENVTCYLFFVQNIFQITKLTFHFNDECVNLFMAQWSLLVQLIAIIMEIENTCAF